ncbi:hypothetical protein [Nostoc sp. 106C]|uniref:hypothetical protein n=1 Tax=Nostoc sp. 106C TaxID=1932667 RepID=UPI000A3AF489|nr:hypothetical protein [Nostoc sp. 106C]OUL32619.1 hypothetical protein BV375_09280 [Nostoc sp. 106C]
MTIAVEHPHKSKSAQICDRLSYPVIDTHVHTQTFSPAFLDYLELVDETEIGDRSLKNLPGASRAQ